MFHVCVQMTSSDVANSLGLAVGRYVYFEKHREIPVNSNAAETTPDTSTAADSSNLVPVEAEAETSGTLLLDSSQDDKGRTDAKLDDASNSSWKKPIDDDADKLPPVHGMKENQLESNTGSDCSGSSSAVMQTDTVVADKNESSTSFGNTDKPDAAAKLDTIEQPDSDNCVDSNVNICSDRSPSEGCPVKSRGELETDGTCDNTNSSTLTSEMPKQSTSSNAFCQSVDGERVCQSDGSSFDSETSAHSEMLSENTADGQQNSSSETTTSLPTADDLEGLLKVISKT